MQTYQTNYNSTLALPLGAADTSMTVATPPTVTKGRIKIGKGALAEWVQYTGVSGSVLTGLTRGLSKTAIPATAGSGSAWIAGTPIKLVAMHDQLPDINEDTSFLNSLNIGDDLTVTGSTTLNDDVVITGANTSVDLSGAKQGYTGPNLTTAQRTAIGQNGMIVYDSDDGVNYQYIGGSWATFATGTTPNASTTVAGRVEIATQSESDAGTTTGGTGANLSATPLETARSVQKSVWTHGTDAGGDDAYTPVLTPSLTTYTVGQSLSFTATTANTGPCTVNFGPSTLNIKTPGGNDPQNGDIPAGGKVTGYYDGTNFVLQSAIQATTAESGVVERLTDVEAAAKTDTTRYPSIAQVAANFFYGAQIVTTTRNTDDASGTVTVAHTLGKAPKFAIGFSNIPADSSARGSINAFWDGTSQFANIMSGTGRSNLTGFFQITNTGGYTNTCQIGNPTTTTIDFVRTRSGSSGGTPTSMTAYILLIA